METKQRPWYLSPRVFFRRRKCEDVTLVKSNRDVLLSGNYEECEYSNIKIKQIITTILIEL